MLQYGSSRDDPWYNEVPKEIQYEKGGGLILTPGQWVYSLPPPLTC